MSEHNENHQATEINQHLWLNILGTNFDVNLSGIDAELLGKLSSAWSRCMARPGDEDLVINLELSDHVDHDDFLQLFTGKLTNLGLEYSDPGQNILIHAAAVADADGIVTGFIGPSGIGKTTLVSTLAKDYGYVTDETLAFDLAEFRVTPYAKPLSLIAGPGPKQQVSPDTLALKAAPADLRLGALYLLDRDPDHLGVPELETLGWLETLGKLVPQMSFLANRQTPLLDLMKVVSFGGGIRALKYRDANDLESFIAHGISSQPADSVLATQLDMPSSQESQGQLPASTVASLRPDDAIRVEDLVVILNQKTITALGAFAADIWTAAVEPMQIDDLVKAMMAMYPAEDLGEDEAKTAVIIAVAELVSLGLMRQG